MLSSNLHSAAYIYTYTYSYSFSFSLCTVVYCFLGCYATCPCTLVTFYRVMYCDCEPLTTAKKDMRSISHLKKDAML